MSRGRQPRCPVEPADRPFGPGWALFIPSSTDRTRDHVQIHRYAGESKPHPDGWMAIQVKPEGPGESRRRASLEEVTGWAANGVRRTSSSSRSIHPP